MPRQHVGSRDVPGLQHRVQVGRDLLGVLGGVRGFTPPATCAVVDADSGVTEVTVDPDAIYVQDGNVWTSAGVTAGIDLALALVADDHGRQTVATVARQLVVYLPRSGGQAQFSVLLAGQAADTEPFRDLLSWLRDHLNDDLSVAALARHINLSERQFTRVFKAQVGPPPQTTSNLSGSSPHAVSWKSPTGASNRSPRPAVSEHPRP